MKYNRKIKTGLLKCTEGKQTQNHRNSTVSFTQKLGGGATTWLKLAGVGNAATIKAKC